MKLTLIQEKALIELIATCKAVVNKEVFFEDEAKNISKATDIIEDMLNNAEIDYTDWDSIDKLGDSLIEFGSVA